MKRLKRVISLVVLGAMLCCCAMLAGCSKFEGVYKFESMTYTENGVTVSLKAGQEALGFMTLSEDFIVLTLNEDGTFEMKNAEEEVATTGTWKKVDGKLEMTYEDVTETYECDGKKITFEDEGATIVLKK